MKGHATCAIEMSDAGDVTGTSYQDTGCGPFCLPPLDTVGWRGGSRIVLPPVPPLSGITVVGIDNAGWITGFSGFNGTTTHAVVWQPGGSTYIGTDLGNLSGKSISSSRTSGPVGPARSHSSSTT